MSASHFVEQLRVLAALPDTASTRRALAAFEAVPRETFAGTGPWKIRSALADLTLPLRSTPDADPKWLYHSVLIVLDEEKEINIGDPSLWVGLLSRAEIQPGTRILQVGAGVGYYTAILSKLVGSEGKVVAYEMEEELAKRATANLVDYQNVELIYGDAAKETVEAANFDLVVSFAGVTHVPSVWETRLTPNARLLLPLTGDDGWGAMILAQRTQQGYKSVTLGRCGFYPCLGARDADLSRQLSKLFSDTKKLDGWHFKMIGKDKDIQIEEIAINP
ncbi:MAG: methyltransferase domain-containing protein [Pseudomonadota bacterium]